MWGWKSVTLLHFGSAQGFLYFFFSSSFLVGAVLLVLLFQGSTRVTEHITACKYKEYSKYQQRVSMLLPLPAFLTAPCFL
jgi:steroid 5-alpha reductase family enzyme